MDLELICMTLNDAKQTGNFTEADKLLESSKKHNIIMVGSDDM